ncbi:MAG: ABC transporter substrate-binding protein [Deltaproteobacteria bacterium]|jgi:branched-chain amino acid transport system substrate-binding protein|nr:ABC transporter substrate-binding protein [Deltaproteobacteria bacterium]MBW2532882.1 ABC transporter substrate-binding protein [Deltaproteobacteria bacterium]
MALLGRCAIPGVAAAAALLSGCMLGNINADECASDATCEQTFGLGSTCGPDGYCSEPAACASSIECRSQFGFGTTCNGSSCVLASVDPRCQLSEPDGLLYELPGRLGDRLLLGGMFALDVEKHRVRADATRLAIRQINNIAGGISGRELGIIICNNDFDGDSSTDATESEELSEYLGGTLGVPVILGPTSSSSAIATINSIIQAEQPTALVSPSATSPQLTDHPDRLDAGDPFGLFWRTCPTDALQGKVLARVVGGVQDGVTVVPDGLDSVVVLYQNDAYGSGLHLEFRAEFEGLSSSHSVSGFSFEVDESDLASAVANAGSVAPAAVVVISSDATRTVNVLEEAGQTNGLLTPQYFLTDGSKDASVLLSNSLTSQAQVFVDAAIGTAPASPSGVDFNVFRDDLQNQFGADASQFSFVAHSYDAAYVGAYGIVYGVSMAAGFTGRDVVDGFSRLTGGDVAVAVGTSDFSSAVSELSQGRSIDIEGTSGPLDFDTATGEAPGNIEVWSVDSSGSPKQFQTITEVLPTD